MAQDQRGKQCFGRVYTRSEPHSSKFMLLGEGGLSSFEVNLLPSEVESKKLWIEHWLDC
jgi:hypothetical protein